jgi:competence protein ComEC
VAKKNARRAKKPSTKEIFLFIIVAVLIIAVLVILTTDNSLKTRINDFLVNIGKDTHTDPDTVPVTGDGKVYTSILSGKGNITLPGYIDTNSLVEIHFVDVGQGDAIIINFPDRKTMLIDAGTTSSGLSSWREEYLQYLYDVTDDRIIEYMVITHADSDHYNMLQAVVENYDVKTAYYNENSGTNYNKFLDVLDDEPGIVLYEVDNQSITYTIEGEGYKVTIFCCGDSAFSGADEKNNQSIICLVEFGGRKVLLTGDAGLATEQWFMTEEYSPYFDVDVLKVGHHGSDTSTGQAFLEYIDAEYAIISCDDGTAYGHPKAIVMERLNTYGLVTYRTNRHGNILLFIDGDGDFIFLTEKPAAPENNSYNIELRQITVGNGE